MNPEDYVSYPIALALKKAGFDEPCRFCYIVDKDTETNIEFTEYASRVKWNSAKIGGIKYPYKHISAPTLWQAQKWLREVKELIIYIKPRFYMGRRPLIGYSFYINEKENRPLTYIKSPTIYDSYEEALSAGIAAALELIEKK